MHSGSNQRSAEAEVSADGAAKKKTPFLAALYILFFRPSLGFGFLEGETLLRTVFRVSALCLLCGLVLTAVRTPPVLRGLREWSDWLATEMSDIRLADGKLAWHPAQPLPYSRHFAGWRVDFVGEGQSSFSPRKRYGPEPRGIWISPAAVYYWERSPDGRVAGRQVVDAGRLFGAFAVAGGGRAGPGGVPVKLDGKNRRLLAAVILTVLGATSVGGVFGEVFFYALMFTLIPVLLRSPQAKIGVPRLLVFYLHISLVPLIVATVYGTLRIPYLDFGQVFAIGFLGYLGFIVISARIKTRKLYGDTLP